MSRFTDSTSEFLVSLRDRAAVRVGLLVVAAVILVITWHWLDVERSRARAERAAAQTQLAAIEGDALELRRLQTLRSPSAPAGRALAEALTASAHARGLAFTVSVLDGGRVRVQGSGRFDETMLWLGAAYRDYRVHLSKFTATRESSGMALVDAVLGASDS